MLTPSYAATATERVLPRMALDFTTGVLDSRVTVARALNTATRVNSSGFIETVNANLPRFDYDPVTLQPRGLLIEEARTNLQTYSETFSSWPTFSGATAPTVTATNPANGSTVSKLTEGVNNGGHVVGSADITVSSGATVTITVYAKPAGRNWIAVYDSRSTTGKYFDVANGVIGGNLVGAPVSASISAGPNGYYRCSITVTAPATTITPQVWLANGNGGFSYQGDGTSGAYLYGAQCEISTFATSYIPNLATGSTTRNADVVSMTGTNFSSWYNQPQGAFALKFIANLTVYSGMRLLVVEDAGFNRVVDLYSYLGTDWFSFNGTTNVVAGAAAISNTPQILTAAYASGSYAACLNGGVVGTAASATLNSPTRMNIGNFAGGSYFNGYIQEILYWPQRVINAEVQAFSK